MLVKNGNKIGFGKLIKTSLEVYYKNFVIWLVVCLLVYSPLCVRDCVVSLRFYNSELMPLGDSDVLSCIVKFFSGISTLGWVLFWLPNVFFVPIGMAVISFVTSQTLLEKNIVVSEILDNSLLKWKRLLLASVFYNIVFFISFYFVFPVVFLVLFYFYSAVIALTDCGAFSSMIMSCILLKKHLVRTAFFILIVKILSLLASFLFNCLINVFFSVSDNFIVYMVVTHFFSSMIGFFLSIILIVWFLNMFSVSIADLVNKNHDQRNKNKKTPDL